MNNTINDVKIPTSTRHAGRDQSAGRTNTTESGTTIRNDTTEPGGAETTSQPTATESSALQTREAAQDALQRLKNQLASQPTEALAAFKRITGQAADNLLGSAVSASS